MVFMKISCPARFDTDNSRTFSPELEVAEGAGSSPEARNLGSLSCYELSFHGHHFRGVIIRVAGKKN